ncbi:MAG: hypothetical protein RI988_1669 [Pseudomonadota bacterium]|jgi:predicted metal-dependent peptidase
MPLIDDEALRRTLERTLIRLRGAHPFFGALALFADFRFDDRVTTAATDGRTIWIAPAFAARLTPENFGGVVVHELLHCALGHIPRMRSRNPARWNLAADIVVNGMIRAETKFQIPEGSVEDGKLAHLSVEEVYERLEASDAPIPAKFLLVDLLPGGMEGEGAAAETADGPVSPEPGDAIARARAKTLEDHWQLARQQAITIARRLNPEFGSTAMGMSRELASLDQPRIPWRSHLWQFVVRTPTDFSGFDRRALWRGLYLDAMDGERVSLRVCVDTSGSIDGPLLTAFLSEIAGILSAYPHLEGQLWYADSDLYGPYPLDDEVLGRRPEGGGGTSFVPFFRAVAEDPTATQAICVYFTDGYGTFPVKPPELPVLWIVVPGGADDADFPFGQVVRMAE